MESLSPEMFRDGILGFICIALIFKGVPAMNDLTTSIKALSEIITALKVQSEFSSHRLDVIENKLHNIESLILSNHKGGD